MKYLSKLILVLLTTSLLNTTYWYEISSLDWSWAKKNYCARNVKEVLWLSTSWNAYEYTKYVDTKEPQVWSIAVIDRHTSDFQTKWTMWYKYWHLSIVISINQDNNTIETTDWIYTLTISQDTIFWYISESKLVELWATEI